MSGLQLWNIPFFIDTYFLYHNPGFGLAKISTFTTMTTNLPLNATIVGGGIGGLFAARVLREQHNVTILEKSGGGNEVGAAVTPGPSTSKWLYKYGCDVKRCGALTLGRVRTLDHRGNLYGTGIVWYQGAVWT